jgi:hypothetical protein
MKNFSDSFDLGIKTPSTTRLFLHDSGFFVMNASFVVSPLLSFQEHYEKIIINVLSLSEDSSHFNDFISSQLISHASRAFPQIYETKEEHLSLQIAIDISLNGSSPSIVKLKEAIDSILKGLLLFSIDYSGDFVCLKV